MSCVVCQVPVERLGWNAKEVHPVRDYQKYAAVAERYVNLGLPFLSLPLFLFCLLILTIYLGSLAAM